MKCRVCDSTDLELVIDLGDQPWCNNFIPADEVGNEPFYPLRVQYCHNCCTSQLDFTVKKEIMFGDHTYLSGTTKSLSAHFKNVATKIDERFFRDKADKSILDIGSNDGTQLQHYKELGYDVLGVESSVGTAQIANDNGINTLNVFFNEETMDEIGRKFSVINASGVFFHLEELHSVCRAIKQGLAEDGVFVVQFLYMKSIMENCAFDQIYHEHLLYYTLQTIEVLLNRHGLAMFDAELAPIHGGSIIGLVTHKDKAETTEKYKEMLAAEKESECNSFDHYVQFSKRIEKMKEDNLKYLKEAKEMGKTIYGFGAPVKGNTMLNYFGVGADLIDCLVEKNELRRGLYSPGMHIPLVIEDEISELPDIYYVLAWNFKKEILKNNEQLVKDGIEFYFPVDPKVSA
ncbi:class I SAM-dependent methyltransferase [Desulfovibrio sp. JC022]|uniref:class I SAM-dependent methyltransferase n=1 Tax=Desulfovibrio sp. JC022 TaxID=2593642 RepID=UPI0013D88E8B|nr:class I SAM-dependent methyltransferase [Desulfovibrio sp. JC022]